MTSLRLARIPQLVAVVIGFLLTLTLASATPVKFDIPAQPAPAALQAFIKQSGLQVVYDADALRTVSANAVQGEFEPLAALQQLLAGTGFTAREQGPSHFVIESATQKPGSVEGSVQSESGRPVAGARVSLAGSNQAVVTDKRGHFVFEDVPAGPQALAITAEGMKKTRVTDLVVRANHRHTLGIITIPAIIAGITQLEDYLVSAPKKDGIVELEPYAVTTAKEKPFSGASIDLQRTKEDVLPFTTFNRRDLELSGAYDLQEFFEKRLSQNYHLIRADENFGDLSDPSATVNQINFRGWGNSESVVLVNGRRIPRKYTAFDNQVEDNTAFPGDYRGLPMGSIERIEVLPSAGSAIYGGGATAGVINIITRKDYVGGQFTVNYETPYDGDAPKRAVSFDYGMPIAWGISARISASFNDSRPLNIEDRWNVTIGRWRHLVAQRDPAQIYGYASPPVSATPNIKLLDTNTFTFHGFTSVPEGYSGGAGVVPFLNRTGYNLTPANGPGSTGGGGTSVGRQATFGTPKRYQTWSIALDKDLSARWRASLDYQSSNNRQTGRGSDLTNTLVVPATASNNPFGALAFVSIYDPRLGDKPELKREQKERGDMITTSLRGAIADWNILADLNFTRNKATFSDFSFFRGLINGTYYFIEDAVNEGLYNPFLDPNVAPPAPESFYRDYIRTEQNSTIESRTYQVSLKGSGAIWTLPTGDVQLTVGVEWTNENRHRTELLTRRINSITGAPANPAEQYRLATLPSFVNESGSIYGELQVPLIGAKRAGWGKSLVAFISGRASEQIRDGYRINSQTSALADGIRRNVYNLTNVSYKTDDYLYSAGFRYDVSESIGLRLSQSSGLRAPLFGQVTPEPFPTTVLSVSDRRRGDIQVSLNPDQYVTGGNVDLKSESTRSTAIGIILYPQIARNLRISVDYFENVREDAIEFLSTQTVLDLERSDPVIAARVKRDGSGNIQFVDARAINFREIKNRSVDFTAEFVKEGVFGGRLVTTVAATKNLSFKIQPSVGSAPIEQIRNPNANLLQLQYNANGNLRWEGRQWTIGWSARYSDKIFVEPASYVRQGSDRIDSAIDHDIVIAYRTRPGVGGGRFGWLLEGAAISVGIKNVFDRDPRYMGGGSGSLGYTQYDSIYGRSVWLQIRKNL